MSQGARTRVQIGSATVQVPHGLTMHEAFGEGATLNVSAATPSD